MVRLYSLKTIFPAVIHPPLKPVYSPAVMVMAAAQMQELGEYQIFQGSSLIPMLILVLMALQVKLE